MRDDLKVDDTRILSLSSKAGITICLFTIGDSSVLACKACPNPARTTVEALAGLKEDLSGAFEAGSLKFFKAEGYRRRTLTGAVIETGLKEKISPDPMVNSVRSLSPRLSEDSLETIRAVSDELGPAWSIIGLSKAMPSIGEEEVGEAADAILNGNRSALWYMIWTEDENLSRLEASLEAGDLSLATKSSTEVKTRRKI